MRNTLRNTLIAGLAGLAGCKTASSYEVHYDRAEVQYVTAPSGSAEHGQPEHAQAIEASADADSVAEKQAVSASVRRPQLR
jgi:hypothetical protein